MVDNRKIGFGPDKTPGVTMTDEALADRRRAIKASNADTNRKYIDEIGGIQFRSPEEAEQYYKDMVLNGQYDTPIEQAARSADKQQYLAQVEAQRQLDSANSRLAVAEQSAAGSIVHPTEFKKMSGQITRDSDEYKDYLANKERYDAEHYAAHKHDSNPAALRAAQSVTQQDRDLVEADHDRKTEANITLNHDFDAELNRFSARNPDSAARMAKAQEMKAAGASQHEIKAEMLAMQKSQDQQRYANGPTEADMKRLVTNSDGLVDEKGLKSLLRTRELSEDSAKSADPAIAEKSRDKLAKIDAVLSELPQEQVAIAQAERAAFAKEWQAKRDAEAAAKAEQRLAERKAEDAAADKETTAANNTKPASAKETATDPAFNPNAEKPVAAVTISQQPGNKDTGFKINFAEIGGTLDNAIQGFKSMVNGMSGSSAVVQDFGNGKFGENHGRLGKPIDGGTGQQEVGTLRLT